MRMQPLAFAVLGLFSISCAGCPSDRARQVEHATVAFDLARDGQSIVFSSAEADLYTLDLNTRKVCRLTDTLVKEMWPSFSPDGNRVLYAAQEADGRGGMIFLTTLDGGRVEQITKDQDVYDAVPRLSDDGSRIAFARAHRCRPYSMGGWTWDDWDVYVMDANGENLTRLTHDNYRGIGAVVFSINREAVLFSADNNRRAKDLSTNVFEVPINGSAGPEPVPPQPTVAGKYAAWASDPRLSTNGNIMIVVSDRASPYQYDLLLVDRNTSQAVPLGATSISRYNKNPVFTPDGKKILFLAGTEWNAGSRPIFSLWSIDCDGKNAKQVVDSQLFSDPSHWSAKD